MVSDIVMMHPSKQEAAANPCDDDSCPSNAMCVIVPSSADGVGVAAKCICLEGYYFDSSDGSRCLSRLGGGGDVINNGDVINSNASVGLNGCQRMTCSSGSRKCTMPEVGCQCVGMTSSPIDGAASGETLATCPGGGGDYVCGDFNNADACFPPDTRYTKT